MSEGVRGGGGGTGGRRRGRQRRRRRRGGRRSAGGGGGGHPRGNTRQAHPAGTRTHILRCDFKNGGLPLCPLHTGTHCIRSQKIELCQVIVVDRHARAFQFRERRQQGLQVSRSKTRPDSHQTSLLLSVSSFVLIIPLFSRLLPLPSTFYSIFVRAFLRSSSYRLFSNRRVMGTAGGGCKLDRDCEI